MTTFAMSVDASLLEDVLADLDLTPEQLERTREAFASRGIEVEVAATGAPRLHFGKGLARRSRAEGLGVSGVYVCTVGLEYGYKKNPETGEEADNADPYNRVAWCGRSFNIRGHSGPERNEKFLAAVAAHDARFREAASKTGRLLYPNGCLDNIVPLERREVKHGAYSADICR